MLNQNPLNTSPLNSWNIPTNVAQDSITINGFSLSNQYIKTFWYDDNLNTKVSTTWRPQADWLIFLSNFKEWRSIKFWIHISWTDEADFTQRLDELRKNIFKKNVFLDMKINWVVRRVNVNCTSSPKSFSHYNKTFLKTELVFQATDSYWYELSNQSTSIDNVTASFQEEITPLGTAETEISAYVLFTTSNSTQIKLTVWDNEMTINHAFTDWDIVRLDWPTASVYVNEVEIDYDDIFPIMEVWTNFFKFEIDWTFNANVLILNKINYV